MPVDLIEWRRAPKGALLGFATVCIGRVLVLKDVAVLTAHGRRWARLPDKPLMDGQNRHRRDARGKAEYATMAEWVNRDSEDRFAANVLAAIDRAHPGDLDDA